jgi:hypothetical protein
MDCPRRPLLLTQLGIAAALLASLGFGGACGAQDSRDGLTQGDDAGAPHGHYLTWAGKTPAHAPTPRAARQAPPPRYVPTPQYHPARAPEAEVGPEAAPPPAYAPQADAQPQPRSLAQGGGSASTGTTHAGTTSVRFYSLHREYGLTPDPVETPTQRPMVLIGPPDHAAAQDQDDDGGDGDKPAHHGDGQDGDQGGAGGDPLSGGVQGGGA